MNFYLEEGNILDLDLYMSIYDNAKKFMAKTNNKNQRDKNYPNKEIIINDIKNKNFKVLKSEEGIECIFSFIKGIDPTYINIYEGKRLNDSPYYVIHRIASTFKHKDIFLMALNKCFKITNHIRIDTSKDNIVMQKALKKAEFNYVGVIYLENGDSRLAYEKVI